MANTGFSGPIVYGPQVRQSKYEYRKGLAMLPAEEFYVVHDDFWQTVATNVPLGWSAAIIDTGCTVTNAALSPGVILFDSDADNEGAAIYGEKSINLTAGEKFFMECRVKVEDASAMTFQFGLTGVTATTNPEDLWTTTETDSLSFGILDAAVLKLVYDKDNAGPVTDTATDTTNHVLADDTWAVLGIGYDGVNAKGYLNGNLVVTASTPAQIPTATELAPFIGMLAGHATTADVAHVDYIRWALQR